MSREELKISGNLVFFSPEDTPAVDLERVPPMAPAAAPPAAAAPTRVATILAEIFSLLNLGWVPSVFIAIEMYFCRESY